MISRTASLVSPGKEEEPLPFGLRVRPRGFQKRPHAILRQADVEQGVLDLILKESHGVKVPAPGQLRLGSRARIASELAGCRKGSNDGLRVRTGLFPKSRDRVIQ